MNEWNDDCKKVADVGENIHVFFNRGCVKYGVAIKITDYRGTRWHQLKTIDGKTYTPYKKVAIRWAGAYMARHGDKITEW